MMGMNSEERQAKNTVPSTKTIAQNTNLSFVQMDDMYSAFCLEVLITVTGIHMD